MRTPFLYQNQKEYKKYILKDFCEPCYYDGCPFDNRHCRHSMCLYKAQRSWKVFRKTQYKGVIL